MKRRKAFLIFLMLVAIVLPPASAQQFFPDRDFSVHERDWYSKSLIALEEPSLLETSKQKKSHSYRFLWLRTFHPPVALRLAVDPEGTGLLTIKVANGAGGYDPGSLITNETIAVSREQVDQVLLLLNAAEFWRSATADPHEVIGVDGAQWIFEGAREGKYHIVDRWSPDKGPYRKLGLFLLELSGLQVKEIY